MSAPVTVSREEGLAIVTIDATAIRVRRTTVNEVVAVMVVP